MDCSILNVAFSSSGVIMEKKKKRTKRASEPEVVDGFKKTASSGESREIVHMNS